MPPDAGAGNSIHDLGQVAVKAKQTKGALIEEVTPILLCVPTPHMTVLLSQIRECRLVHFGNRKFSKAEVCVRTWEVVLHEPKPTIKDYVGLSPVLQLFLSVSLREIEKRKKSFTLLHFFASRSVSFI